MSRRRPSFSWRLMTAFALLSLVGVAMTVAIMQRTARDALLASTVDRLALSSLERGEAIRRWVGDRKREVEFVAALSSFRRVVGEAADPSASPEAADPFVRLLAVYPDFDEVSLLSPATGEVLLSTDPARKGESRGGERYFREGRKGTFFQKPSAARGAGRGAMTVATPVPAPSGALAAVLAARLRPDRLGEVVREPRGTDRAPRVVLVDRLYRPVEGSSLPGAATLPGEIRTKGVERALGGETGWDRYPDREGVRVIGYYRWLPALDLGLVVEMGEEDAFAPLKVLRIRLAVVGLLVAALISLLVYAVAKRFAAPVLALTAAVREVEGGNLEVAVPEGSPDEMGALGSAFNRMTTHLKELYGALQESERSYREIFDATSDSILIHDAATGEILDSNRAASVLFGYGREEFLRLSLAQLGAKGVDGGEEFRRRIARAVLHGPQRFEWLARRRDGREVWAEVILAASEIGGKGRVLSSTRDITGRKEIEAELVLHRERLEELVRERTGALEEAQGELLKRERFAVMGQLIATVSHELRNPLGTVRNCIYSFGEAVRRGNVASVSHSLVLAERNIRRCGSIIDELLDYSRVREARPVPMEAGPFLEILLDEQVLPEGVALARDTGAAARAALDPVLFRRCFQNVVENAIQAMEAAGGTGHLLSVGSVPDGERLEIRVADTGPGVPEELRERVFEPLFSTKSTGVGLGLPLVKDVMEKHRGGVEIRSAPGGGALVVLWLPLLPPEPRGDRREG